jgi:hypothetical protein
MEDVTHGGVGVSFAGSKGAVDAAGRGLSEGRGESMVGRRDGVASVCSQRSHVIDNPKSVFPLLGCK